MPAPTADFRSGPLNEYWRARAEQHTSDTYCGIPLVKFPEGLRVYEHLLWDSSANVVIEVGTHSGGSALWFRDRLTVLAARGRIRRAVRVISVDIDQRLARAALPRDRSI